MNTRTILKLSLLATLAAAILIAVINRGGLDAGLVRETIASYGLAGPIVFVILFALATLLFLPGMVFGLAGGALWGPLWGTLFNLVGATLGAVLAFLAARFLLSDWVRARMGGRLARLVEGVEKEGWRFVAFVRLVPLFPFNLVNYAFGLTRIDLLTYAATTFLAMIPGALAFSYLGYAGMEAAAGGEALIGKGLIALALLATVAFLPRLVRLVRGEAAGRDDRWTIDDMRVRLDQGKALHVIDVRTKADYDGPTGHIDGALNLPLEELDTRLGELASFKSESIGIVCTTDRRSDKASVRLAAAGFTDVHVVTGGMTAWRAAGLPTSFTSTDSQTTRGERKAP